MQFDSNVFNKLDKKISELGFNINKFSVKPCPNKFFFNKEKNSIILNEKEINDECNYIHSIHLILNELDPKKSLYFINFANFTPAIILAYFQIISQNHDVIIFCNDFNELQDFATDKLKILPTEKAEEFNLIKRRSSGKEH